MNKNLKVFSLYVAIVLAYYFLITSCNTTSSVVTNSLVKPKWIYKIETVSKDGDTTFQKTIR